MSSVRLTKFGLLVGLLFHVLGSEQIYGAADSARPDAAKIEDRVVWWTTVPIDQSKVLADQFRKQFPAVDVDLFRTGATSLQNKIMTEARVGRHSWDLVNFNGEFVLELVKQKLIAPYVSPQQVSLEDDFKDGKGYWSGLHAQPIVLGYNTKLVKKEDVPTTYEALLNSRWKGKKISIDNEGFGLLKGLESAWGKQQAVDYLKKLAALEPVPMRGNTHRVQLVAAGEYPLLIAYAHSIESAKHAGAPIDWLPLEPVPVQLSAIMMAAKAPHPNGARRFIDFLLSSEAQLTMRKMKRIPLRKDVEPDPPRLLKGYKRVALQPEGYTDVRGLIKLYGEIFNVN
ncbi:MAG: ABC transporter substrate-binding protein [Candidatus Binatia bacterium]